MRELTVASVMTTDVITVSPQAPFKDVVATLSGHGISAVPVVGRDGAPVGVVSEADVLPKQEFKGGAEPLPRGQARRRVRWYRSLGLSAAEVMTTPVLTIGPGEPVAVAARRMAEQSVRRLFVIDSGRLVGVVSRRDLLGVFLRPDSEIRADIENDVLRRELGLTPGSVVVDVVDGVAAVDGVVDLRSETELTCRLVQTVPGVVSVRSTLRYRIDDQQPTSVWTGYRP